MTTALSAARLASARGPMLTLTTLSIALALAGCNGSSAEPTPPQTIPEVLTVQAKPADPAF